MGQGGHSVRMGRRWEPHPLAHLLDLLQCGAIHQVPVNVTAVDDMQMPLWVSGEEEIKEGSWKWLEQALLESKEEAVRKSCGPWQEPPFTARDVKA